MPNPNLLDELKLLVSANNRRSKEIKCEFNDIQARARRIEILLQEARDDPERLMEVQNLLTITAEKIGMFSVNLDNLSQRLALTEKKLPKK